MLQIEITLNLKSLKTEQNQKSKTKHKMEVRRELENHPERPAHSV